MTEEMIRRLIVLALASNIVSPGWVTGYIPDLKAGCGSGSGISGDNSTRKLTSWIEVKRSRNIWDNSTRELTSWIEVPYYVPACGKLPSVGKLLSRQGDVRR
ncbi:hypothetical protein DFJ77DRAFT_442293 [Powellomyces hirtus]|nr:hypothetical protein DFJ77DRAFT_442293 [Powellomyces hirtus]